MTPFETGVDYYRINDSIIACFKAFEEVCRKMVTSIALLYSDIACAVYSGPLLPIFALFPIINVWCDRYPYLIHGVSMCLYILGYYPTDSLNIRYITIENISVAIFILCFIVSVTIISPHLGRYFLPIAYRKFPYFSMFYPSRHFFTTISPTKFQ